jgi:hypothetical protein
MQENNQKIWIVGCPRSGTTFITNLIGEKTKYCFDEPWSKYPLGKHKNWNLPDNGSLVFKYCANCFYYDEIKKIYPNSKWIYITRDPIHILYSIVFLKKDSYPKRTFFEKENKFKKIIKTIKMMSRYVNACKKIKEALIINYENIDYEKLSNFLKIKIENQKKFINRNLSFEKEKMILLKKILNSKKML